MLCRRAKNIGPAHGRDEKDRVGLKRRRRSRGSAPPHFIFCQPRDASSCAQTTKYSTPSHLISAFGSPFLSPQCDRMHQLVGPSRGLSHNRADVQTPRSRGGVASSRSLSAIVDMMHRKRGSNMVKAQRDLGEAVQHVSSLWWHPRAAVTPPLTPCVTRRHCQRIALSALR